VIAPDFGRVGGPVCRIRYTDFREHYSSRTFVNDGKKKARGYSTPRPLPALGGLQNT